MIAFADLVMENEESSKVGAETDEAGSHWNGVTSVSRPEKTETSTFNAKVLGLAVLASSLAAGIIGTCFG